MSALMGLDLVMLVPGKDERETFDELLSSRKGSLHIRDIRYEILVHPRRDPGCFLEAPDILQSYQSRARYCLIVLDHQGSGQESREADEVVIDLKTRMEKSGWLGRVEVLVLEPELENWVWSSSPHVSRTIGWEGQDPPLRQWLIDRGWWQTESAKPTMPKECLQAALRRAQIRRSSAIYRELAARVGLRQCQDEAFLAFCELVRKWFPETIS